MKDPRFVVGVVGGVWRGAEIMDLRGMKERGSRVCICPVRRMLDFDFGGVFRDGGFDDYVGLQRAFHQIVCEDAEVDGYSVV